MAWKTAEFDFHAVELFRGGRKTTTPPAGAGKASGARVDLIPEPCRFKGTVDFVFRLDAPPPTPTTPEPRRSADSPAPP